MRAIDYRVDISNYEQLENIESLKLNDIAKVNFRTAQPVPFDSYQQNRSNGAAILIDETSDITVGACMLGWGFVVIFVGKLKQYQHGNERVIVRNQ